MLEKGRSLAGDVPNILGAMGQVYALGGETERARELLAQLEQKGQDAWVPSTVFAIVHLGLGEHDRALDWLERGCRQHELPMTSLKVHPVYDPLRAHAAIPGGAAPAAHGLRAPDWRLGAASGPAPSSHGARRCPSSSKAGVVGLRANQSRVVLARKRLAWRPAWRERVSRLRCSGVRRAARRPVRCAPPVLRRCACPSECSRIPAARV